jgi:hemerythrin-like domain-containing protein
LRRGLIDRLDEEHARGEHRIRELQHALTAFECLGAARRDAFEDAAQRYVDFYLTHMMLEEREILPLAERALTPQDWDELDAEMAEDIDPLVAGDATVPYDALFHRIVARIPAPLGLGERAS